MAARTCPSVKRTAKSCFGAWGRGAGMCAPRSPESHSLPFPGPRGCTLRWASPGSSALRLCREVSAGPWRAEDSEVMSVFPSPLPDLGSDGAPP